ncbi:hypothetical protein [Kitasatospora sp. NPDC088783]|uniref:hypothetical protein n=1 Tax=Kitasatospora sp. NPDC088783 TaxID=3364077 RepID=UPI00380EF5B9
MPKKQSTAARNARARQATTGEPYTTALRATQALQPGSPRQAEAFLAALLSIVGEQPAAAVLERHMDIDRRSELLTAAYVRADRAVHHARNAPPHVLGELKAALDEADRACLDWCEQRQPQAPFYAAYIALCHAGQSTDPQQIAAVACAVLGGPDLDFGVAEEFSDDIRGWYGGGWPQQEPLRDLSGPDTPQSTAARQAAERLYEARNTPSRGDEDWHHAAELIIEAGRLAAVAASEG